jgi:hypothetical protein
MASTQPNQPSLFDLVQTDMSTPLSPSFLSVLNEPPFIPIPGVINLRDVGAVTDPSSSTPNPLRKGLIYRSGALNQITEEGKRMLRDELGVKVILDLRSKGERGRNPEPVIEGVEAVWFDCVGVSSLFLLMSEMNLFIAAREVWRAPKFLATLRSCPRTRSQVTSATRASNNVPVHHNLQPR